MISLWQMTVVREIMKAGSISAAARQLGRTQPALSATVKELERNMNCQLFERQKGRLIRVPEAFFCSTEPMKFWSKLMILNNY